MEGSQEKKYLHTEVSPPFRTPKGKYIQKGLFFETLGINQDIESPIQDSKGPRPIFTLKPYDHEIPPESVCYREDQSNLLRSLYQIYLEYGDPSEYSFAIGVFDSWEHWNALREATFFQKYYKRMREALQAKIESETLLAARKVMKQGGGPMALQAAKWLRDAVKPAKGRGRPSKEEINAELKKQAELVQDGYKDLERLGLLKDSDEISKMEADEEIN